eukprot:m.212650 g.212650  ORF g.212650 m.212650 type:complete len:1358 (-) comp16947_c2_seq8:172-4245(-)
MNNTQDDVFVIAVQAEPELQKEIIPAIQQQFPLRHIKWKSVVSKVEYTSTALSARVRPFISEDVMPPSSSSLLHRQPIVHVYATRCQDLNEYRQKRRYEVQQWFEQVQSRQHAGWLIVHVTPTPEKVNKTLRISLREGVLDRLRSDFGAKNSAEWCVQLPSRDAVLQKDLNDSVWTWFADRLRACLLDHLDYRLDWLQTEANRLVFRQPSQRNDEMLFNAILAQDDLALCHQAAGLHSQAIHTYRDLLELVTDYTTAHMHEVPLVATREKDGHLMSAVAAFLHPLDIDPPPKMEGISFSSQSLAKLRNKISSHCCSLMELHLYLSARLARLFKAQRRMHQASAVVLDCIYHVSCLLSALPSFQDSDILTEWRCLACLDAVRFLHIYGSPQLDLFAFSPSDADQLPRGLLQDLTTRTLIRFGVSLHHLPRAHPFIAGSNAFAHDIAHWQPDQQDFRQVDTLTDTETSAFFDQSTLTSNAPDAEEMLPDDGHESHISLERKQVEPDDPRTNNDEADQEINKIFRQDTGQKVPVATEDVRLSPRRTKASGVKDFLVRAMQRLGNEGEESNIMDDEGDPAINQVADDIIALQATEEDVIALPTPADSMIESLEETDERLQSPPASPKRTAAMPVDTTRAETVTQPVESSKLAQRLRDQSSRSILRNCQHISYFQQLVKDLATASIDTFQLASKRRLATIAMHRLAAVYLVTDAIVEAEALFSHTSRQAHADRWPELHISSLQGLCACYAHRKKWSRLAASCCNLLAVAKDPSLSLQYSSLLEQIARNGVIKAPLMLHHVLEAGAIKVQADTDAEPTAGSLVSVLVNIRNMCSAPLTFDSLELCFAQLNGSGDEPPKNVSRPSLDSPQLASQVIARQDTCPEDLILSTKASDVVVLSPIMKHEVVVGGRCRSGDYVCSVIRLRMGSGVFHLPLAPSQSSVHLRVLDSPVDVSFEFEQAQLQFVRGFTQIHTGTLRPGTLGLSRFMAMASFAPESVQDVKLQWVPTGATQTSEGHLQFNGQVVTMTTPVRKHLQLHLQSSTPLPAAPTPIVVTCQPRDLDASPSISETSPTKHQLNLKLFYVKLLSAEKHESSIALPCSLTNLFAVQCRSWLHGSVIIVHVVLNAFALACTISDPILEIAKDCSGADTVSGCEALFTTDTNTFPIKSAADEISFAWRLPVAKLQKETKRVDVWQGLLSCTFSCNACSLSPEEGEAVQLQIASNSVRAVQTIALSHPLAVLNVSWRGLPDRSNDRQAPPGVPVRVGCDLVLRTLLSSSEQTSRETDHTAQEPKATYMVNVIIHIEGDWLLSGQAVRQIPLSWDTPATMDVILVPLVANASPKLSIEAAVVSEHETEVPLYVCTC